MYIYLAWTLDRDRYTMHIYLLHHPCWISALRRTTPVDLFFPRPLHLSLLPSHIYLDTCTYYTTNQQHPHISTPRPCLRFCHVTKPLTVLPPVESAKVYSHRARGDVHLELTHMAHPCTPAVRPVPPTRQRVCFMIEQRISRCGSVHPICAPPAHEPHALVHV